MMLNLLTYRIRGVVCATVNTHHHVGLWWKAFLHCLQQRCWWTHPDLRLADKIWTVVALEYAILICLRNKNEKHALTACFEGVFEWLKDCH